MSHTRQYLDEGRESPRKGDARAEQISVGVQAAAAGIVWQGAVVATEVRDDADVFEGFVLHASFPTVKIGMSGDGGGWTGLSRARKHSGFLDRCAEVGVTAEHVESILRAQRSWEKQSNE